MIYPFKLPVIKCWCHLRQDSAAENCPSSLFVLSGDGPASSPIWAALAQRPDSHADQEGDGSQEIFQGITGFDATVETT